MAKRRYADWTSEDFENEVATHFPSLVAPHQELLGALGRVTQVRIGWEGRGATHATYHVHVPEMDEHILRVRASGGIQALWMKLAEQEQPLRAALYRERLGNWIIEDAGGCPWLSKKLDEIDINALVAIITEVARHPAH